MSMYFVRTKEIIISIIIILIISSTSDPKPVRYSLFARLAFAPFNSSDLLLNSLLAHIPKLIKSLHLLFHFQRPAYTSILYQSLSRFHTFLFFQTFKSRSKYFLAQNV